MKKLLFLLVFMGLAVAVFYSCKKDGLNNQQPNSKKTYTAEEMQIWRNLTNFNQKVKTGVRDEEFISPDSAMWYLEALYNATQTTDTTFNDLFTFERTYSLAVNENGTVNMSDVVLVYNQMLSDLNSEFSQLTEDYKFSVVGDLEQQPTRDGSTITLGFTGGIGINPLALYDPITTDDNWRYGNMKGKCVNSQWDSDAGIQLKVRFNNPAMSVDTTGTWLQYYVPIVDHNEFPGKIFYEVANSDPCIEYNELQSYLSNGHYIIHNTSTDVPVGKRPQGYVYRFMDLWTNSDNPSDNKYWHKYQIFYGQPSNIPPIE